MNNSIAKALAPMLEPEPSKTYKNPPASSAYEIVSIAAYLLGVPRCIFDKDHEPPKPEIYDKLDKWKEPRIIRNLCLLRSAIEKNYLEINSKIFYDLKNLHTLPELVPQEAINQLSSDGIELIKANYELNNYLIDINRHITNHINNCKSQFPIWLKWDYIKNLFIMPDGTTASGLKKAGEEFNRCRSFYPYQTYLNWSPAECGNILYNDERFVTWLYESNYDLFDDLSKVRDASPLIKDSIYDFLADSDRTVFLVDCENSDPYKLFATLRNLNQDELGKVVKIMLFNDVHTSSAWTAMTKFLSIPVEHLMVQRIKDDKSLVDARLIAGACREYYSNSIDSFVIVSSDSDYWALISGLSEARYMLMVEYENFGVDLKTNLVQSGIFYCYIDRFCTGNIDDFRRYVLCSELEARFETFSGFNVKNVFCDAMTSARADMSDTEKGRFYERYIKKMRLTVNEDGTVRILLGE